MTTKHSSLAGRLFLRNRKKRRLYNQIRISKAVISRAIKSNSETDQTRAMLIAQNTILDSFVRIAVLGPKDTHFAANVRFGIATGVFRQREYMATDIKDLRVENVEWEENPVRLEMT